MVSGQLQLHALGGKHRLPLAFHTALSHCHPGLRSCRRRGRTVSALSLGYEDQAVVISPRALCGTLSQRGALAAFCHCHPE